MICSSFSYPNMFDVSRGKVNLYTDSRSVINRVKLLLLTEPTELYMNPTFGVGLRRYLYTYNNDNTIAMIKDRLIEQLRMWEPEVIPEETKVTRGVSSDSILPVNTSGSDINHLKLTVTLTLSSGNQASFGVDESDFKNIH